MNYSDKELIQNYCKTGKQIYFNCLYKKHYKLVYCICLKHRVYQEADIQDIMQDSFIRLNKYLHKYNFQYRFSTWFGKIIKNCLIDFKRKNINITTKADIYSFFPDNHDVDKEILVKQAKEKLFKILNEEKNRKMANIFFYRTFYKYKHQETAKILNMKHTTVRVYYKRGLKRYMEKLFQELNVKKTTQDYILNIFIKGSINV